MVSRDWKPGDVAMVEVGCWANQRVALRLAEGWSHTNGVNVDGDGVVIPVRPLVVIDPEDREQVEALILAWAKEEPGARIDDLAVGVTRAQAALRSLIADPKPAEPMGLGAVVEDAEGRRWVRLEGDDPAWTAYDPSDDSHSSTHYSYIAAVKVLSEGMTQ